MKRREFIKRSAVASVGGLLMPSAFLSSCAAGQPLPDVEYDGNVLIIGAGAAGLYAGHLLKSRGIDFSILEATSLLGGRLGKITGFCDHDLDTGAQWLHGRHSIMGELVRETGTEITLDNSGLDYWFRNQVVGELPKDPFIFEKKGLPDVSFMDYAHQQGFGPAYDYIIEALAGDLGADASLLSAYWNYREFYDWSSGKHDYKFRKTYFDLINEHIAKPVLDKIQFNTPIVAVNHSGKGVQLTDSAGRKQEADKVIVTVPISILKGSGIAFSPPLPVEKTSAFAKIGMGPGMKVFLKFSKKFFAENMYGGRVCASYADDAIGKVTNDNILMAFIMGEQAADLHDLASDELITEALLRELDTLHNGQASASFMGSSVQDFTAMPYIKGAYSFSTIGMGNARQVAARPVGNKLFFAGEAMNTSGEHQTVHGAAASGRKAVVDLLGSVAR